MTAIEMLQQVLIYRDMAKEIADLTAVELGQRDCCLDSVATSFGILYDVLNDSYSAGSYGR